MHVQLGGGDPRCQTPLYEISFLISLLSASSAPLSSSQALSFWLLDQISRLLYICSAVHSCNRVSLPHQAGRGQREQKPLGFSVCSWDQSFLWERSSLPSGLTLHVVTAAVIDTGMAWVGGVSVEWWEWESMEKDKRSTSKNRKAVLLATEHAIPLSAPDAHSGFRLLWLPAREDQKKNERNSPSVQ